MPTRLLFDLSIEPAMGRLIDERQYVPFRDVAKWCFELRRNGLANAPISVSRTARVDCGFLIKRKERIVHASIPNSTRRSDETHVSPTIGWLLCSTSLHPETQWVLNYVAMAGWATPPCALTSSTTIHCEGPLTCFGLETETEKEENIHGENEDHFCNRLSMATPLQSRKRETLEAVDGVKFCPLGHKIVSDVTIQDSRLFL